MSSPAAKVSRRMEYPYTFTAKVFQFPYKFYFTKQWVWKTLPIGITLTSLLMLKIQGMSNTDENKAKWKEIRRKEREHHHD